MWSIQTMQRLAGQACSQDAVHRTAPATLPGPNPSVDSPRPCSSSHHTMRALCLLACTAALVLGLAHAQQPADSSTAPIQELPAFSRLQACVPFNVLVQPSLADGPAYGLQVDAAPEVEQALSAIVQGEALLLETDSFVTQEPIKVIRACVACVRGRKVGGRHLLHLASCRAAYRSCQCACPSPPPPNHPTCTVQGCGLPAPRTPRRARPAGLWRQHLCQPRRANRGRVSRRAAHAQQ